MMIKEISDNDSFNYNELATKYGTIFNTIDWLKTFEGNARAYGIYDKGDNLIGGFSTYKENKYGFKIYCNPPFTPCIGPFLETKATNPVTVMNVWKKVLSSMADFIERLPYSVISICLNQNIVDTQPFIWRKFKVTPGYTYVLDLSRSIEDIHNRLSVETRHHIKKGAKDGLVVKQVDDFGIVRSLVLKTFLRQGKKAHEYYLGRILFEFANRDNSFAFAVFRDDKPIAASFCTHDSHTAFLLLSGYDHENKHHGAGPMAVSEAISCARESGLKYFDFEGSMIPQIEKYFRGFGGKLRPYYRINKAKLPLEILLKFFKRELF